VEGYNFTRFQSKFNRHALRKQSYSKVPQSQVDANRHAFNKVENDLIAEWGRETNQTWPRYAEDVPKKNGEPPPARKKGQPYDAHHWIENELDGPATWWNIHPAKFPDVHQGGIHGAGSPLSELLKDLE
jgi:filamentous hemagglutinin